jgi:hypothetical protein
MLPILHIPAINSPTQNKGAGVPFYDSIATYDSGLFYDDSSSPQPTRKKMAKVKLGLKNLTRDQKIDQANTIKTAMTGNANFTTPNPTLASYGTLITTAQTKLNAYNLLKAQTDTALADCDAAFRTFGRIQTPKTFSYRLTDAKALDHTSFQTPKASLIPAQGNALGS